MHNIVSHQGNANQNYCTSTRMAIKNTSQVINIGEGMERLEPLYIAGRIVQWYSH